MGQQFNVVIRGKITTEADDPDITIDVIKEELGTQLESMELMVYAGSDEEEQVEVLMGLDIDENGLDVAEV